MKWYIRYILFSFNGFFTWVMSESVDMTETFSQDIIML